MRIKKVLSVFLAAVMLFTVMSIGITGAAVEIDYAAQYRWLAEALQNEYVRELTNYDVTNATLDNETGGFDQEARGFAYDHKVVARDNEAGDILKAANRFYYIAENIMSFKYGVGCYDPSTLLSYISEKIKPYFASTSGSGEIIYEDFYGDRYYPTEEEIAAYNKAVSDILAVGAQVSQATLTEAGIYFMEMDDWSYYNVDTLLRYFVGNVVKINTGNWFHRFSFIVQTSVNNILEDCTGISSIGNNMLTIRTAVYQVSYQREYNESKSKAYYCFEQPTAEQVWQNYATEYGLDRVSADLTVDADGYPVGLLKEGQAEAFLIKITYDETTVPYLQGAYAAFDSIVSNPYNAELGLKWDSYFVFLSDDAITNGGNDLSAVKTAFVNDLKDRLDDKYDGAIDSYASFMSGVVTSDYITSILKYAGELSSMYSNKALQSVFGANLGNMVTLAYLMKTSRSDPQRTVRGEAKYVATAEKLDDIIHDIDALISPNPAETDDVKISNRVATVLSMFLDIGGLLGVEETIDYSTLEDLVGKILQKLVFTDSIINMLVEMIYPMIVDLIVNNLGTIDVIGGIAVDLVGSILDNNNLAIYPNKLGELLEKDYGDKYKIAATILKNGGDNWANVNCAGIVWGVDDAPVSQKRDVFINALCAALSGFTRLLVTFLCGDAEYENDESDERFGKNYDLKVIKLGLDNVWLASQGLYTKLFIPLYRVLGLAESEFLSSAAYHAAMEKNFKDCLRLAVTPIVDWVFNHVAKKPIETIMKLVPNLVHFLSREGGPLEHENDWTGTGHLTTSNQWEAHAGFAELQTHNLLSILDHVHLKIVLAGQAIHIGSIAGLVGEGTLGMLTSLNALLNEVIAFEYDTDEIYSRNIACYSDNNGDIIVLPDSTEYAMNPSAYPKAHMQYYSDSSDTKRSLTQDEEHPFLHENITYVAKPFYLPAIPEAKLLSCGEVNTAHNTINVTNPGLVFKFLLRYIISALGYRYTLETVPEIDENGYETGFMVAVVPTLIECLGINMDDELFMGLTFESIIANVMIHPDEAICALLELFYSNEEGDLYHKGKESYTYPVEPIDYHEDVLLDEFINPTLSYGAPVKYSEYWTKEYANDFVSSLGPLAEDVLVMLGIEGMEDGLGPFLENMLNENVFTNDLINTLFNAIYQLIGTLKDNLGIDIEGILNAVLDVSFAPVKVGRAIDKMLGFETEAALEIRNAENWMQLFDGGIETDPVTGEETQLLQDVDYDWGLKVVDGVTLAEQNGMSRAEAFVRVVSALLSPAAFLIKFLFMDEDLSILGLINLNSYPGYQYAFIGLLEALSCPNILTYNEYYEASLDPDCGDANVIYHLFSPILGLLDKVYMSPIDTILNLLPNLLFFISVGGLSDFVNNLIHFAYVLLDILRPIIDGYDLLDGLMSNIEISGLTLNLSLPLDLDVNSLVSDLLGALVGDVLTIEGVQIQLPYIDIYTICVGTLQSFTSKEQRIIAHLNPAGGGELLTSILRIVFEVLFMEENHRALTKIISNLAGEGKLDAYDEETLYMVVNGLIGLIEEYEVLDMVLWVVYMLVTKLVPIADTLAPRLQANDMTIMDLIDSASDMDAFMANIALLMKDPNETEVPDTTPDLNAMTSLLDRLLAFFEKIKLFFQQLFTFG